MMRNEDAEAFTEGLGHIGVGLYKQIAWAHKQRIPQALGYRNTPEWVHARLGGYIEYELEKRREIAAELREDGHSNRAVAQVLGVDEKTIRNDGAEFSAPQPGNLNDTNDEKDTGAEYSAPRGTQGTGNNEWYTPAEVIQAARSVLGGIDLDPASSEHAQGTVQALRYFTLKDDGLTQDWRGTVWLNPPYAQPHIENFADKMIAEIKALHVTSAIMLTHNYTDTAWFHKLAAGADAICFTKGRIRFEAPDGTLAAPTQGQAFFYFGSQTARFLQVFKPLGFVVGALIT